MMRANGWMGPRCGWLYRASPRAGAVNAQSLSGARLHLRLFSLLQLAFVSRDPCCSAPCDPFEGHALKRFLG